MSYRPQYRNQRGFIALDPNGLQFKINARSNDARRLNQESARKISAMLDDDADRTEIRAALAARVVLCESTVCQITEQHPEHS